MARVTALVYMATGSRGSSGGTVVTPKRLYLPLLANASTIYAPSVVQENALQLPLVVNDNTVYPPSLIASNAIALPLLVNTQTFYPPQLNQRIILGFVNNSQTFYPLIVSTNTVLALPLLTNVSTVYPPQLNMSVSLPFVSNTSTIYPPAVVLDTSQLITLPLVTNSQTFYGMQLNQQVRLPLVTNVSGFLPFTVGNVATPGFSLSTPTATKTSSAGQELEVNVVMGLDIRAGVYLRIQRSLDGLRNASDGTYSNAVLNLAHLVTGNEEEALHVTNDDLAPDGYFSANGLHFQQYRWERDDGALSAWSNQISDTVTGPVASFPVVNGPNKNQSVTLNGYTWSCANQGAQHGVRTMQAKSGKGHAEFTVGSINSTGSLRVGVVDGAFAIGPSQFVTPGGTASTLPVPGCTLAMTSTGAWTCFRNGGSVAGNIGFAPAAGHVIAMEFDTATNVISFYYRANGATQLITTQTLSGTRIPAAWHGYAGGMRAGDSGTANFGKSAFSVTPTTGYSGW